MKRLVTALLLCLCFFTPALAAEAIPTVKEATAENAIYIAGNPDLYPIEYYDGKDGLYKGILPSLYGDIAERTGLSFTYVHAGVKNQQARLAKNRQVEIISAHTQGSVKGLADQCVILSLEDNGNVENICIGFTDIAPAEVIKTVKAELQGMTDSELLQAALDARRQPAYTPALTFLLVIALILLIAAVILLRMFLHSRKHAKQRQEIALTDPLTGIGNERYFVHCFANTISPATHSLYFTAYIAFELAFVERYLGTDKTEEMQRFAAGILASSAGDVDFAARITDGVFVFTFQCPSEEQARIRIEELLSKLNGGKETGLGEHRTMFRAGVYHLASANMPCEMALFNARQGYHHAVRHKLDYAFSSTELLGREARQARLRSTLTNALENGEFRIFMQFIVEANTGRICGAEGLSRWENPKEGLIMPGQYINAMKDAGIIDRLDFFVLEECCKQLERWKGNDMSGLWLSCNFTRLTVSHEDFLERFYTIINRYQFERRRLVIELTEDSLVDNQAMAYHNVLACKKAGFRIALDDLGSGYSSFSDLCDYPIDIIKIDRHIVAKSTTKRGNTLLQGITRLAHDLDMQVLCEGVETEHERLNARLAGCDYIQGYYYCRVLPPEEAYKFYASH